MLLHKLGTLHNGGPDSLSDFGGIAPDGLEAVCAACAEALATGTASRDVVLTS